MSLRGRKLNDDLVDNPLGRGTQFVVNVVGFVGRSPAISFSVALVWLLTGMGGAQFLTSHFGMGDLPLPKREPGLLEWFLVSTILVAFPLMTLQEHLYRRRMRKEICEARNSLLLLVQELAALEARTPSPKGALDSLRRLIAAQTYTIKHAQRRFFRP